VEASAVFHNLLEKREGTFRPAQNVTPHETGLANIMSAAWIRFAKDPAGKDGGWGHQGLSSVAEGPCTAWQTPPATVKDLGTLLRYAFWSTINPVAH